MGKLLHLKDYILIASALVGDTVEDLRLAGGILPKVLEGYYGFVPNKYKHSSYITTVSRMLSTGDITKSINNKGEVQLELTSLGTKKFKRRFKLFLQSRKWDGLFMMVIFDIAEINRHTRNKLRFKLKELGFGMLQKSVWISPYHFEEDMREFLTNHGLETNVFVFSGRKLLAGDLKLMAKNTWKLSLINTRYQEILNQLRQSENLSSSKKSKHIFNITYQTYLEVLTKDPLLPKALLPKDWLRPKVLTALNQLARTFKQL